MKAKKLAELSLLTAVATIIFIIELRIPNIIPIPGIKLGLANIITVYAAYRFSAKDVLLIAVARVFLGSLFGGNFSVIIYSLSGALACLAGMLLLRKIIPLEYVWLCQYYRSNSPQYRANGGGDLYNAYTCCTCVLSAFDNFRLNSRTFYRIVCDVHSKARKKLIY